MEYRLAEIKIKLDQMSDKLGSDYFTLVEILNTFETACYDFIGSRLKHIEKNQEITDDMRTLITDPQYLPVALAPAISSIEDRYIAAIPTNYLRLISYDLVYDDGTRCRRADLLRHGEQKIANNDPTRKASKQYPHILEKSAAWEINAGASATPDKLIVVYAKKPSFATTGDKNTRIVNLPDDAIERILLNTVKHLFSQTADERTPNAHQLEDAYRKAFA